MSRRAKLCVAPIDESFGAQSTVEARTSASHRTGCPAVNESAAVPEYGQEGTAFVNETYATEPNSENVTITSSNSNVPLWIGAEISRSSLRMAVAVANAESNKKSEG